MKKRFDFHKANKPKHANTFYSHALWLLCLITVLTAALVSIPLTVSAEGANTESSGISETATLPLTIDGAIGVPFNFEKGSNYQTYIFAIHERLSDIQTYEWSVEGTLPEGLSLMDSDTPEAYIGGAATEETDAPVSLTVSVRAIASNGDIYYGETDILIGVYMPVNPFEDVENLLKSTDCTVPMTTANTANAVSDWLNNTWLSSIEDLQEAFGDEMDISILSVVTGTDFAAAKAGTATDRDGTDGSVSFTVVIEGEIPVCEGLVCTVKATAYSHTHSFSESYSYDGTHHWRECTDAECDEVSNKARHSGGTATYTERAVCEVCGQPYGEVAVNTTSLGGTITVGSYTWNSTLDEITFDLFFKEAQTVAITAADTEIGVKKIEYCLSDKKLDNITQAVWTEYTEGFNIDQEKEYVIYVKITDKDDNYVIINSNGLVIDKTAPVIKGIENGKVYCDTVIGVVNEKYLDEVYLDGVCMLPVSNNYILGPSDNPHTLTATDKAGNSVSYSITVYKGHTWSENPRTISDRTHAIICIYCNIVRPDTVLPHSFSNLYDMNTCDGCEYTTIGGLDAVTVSNDPSVSGYRIGLSGVGIALNDSLITELTPPGSPYQTLLDLADGGDVLATYDIYLQSGQKSADSAMYLSFDLGASYAGEDFTLLHAPKNGETESFYGKANSSGDISFGPLYELSPFMLVKGTLASPQESDSDNLQTDGNGNLWLWIAISIVFVSAAVFVIIKKFGKAKGEAE